MPTELRMPKLGETMLDGLIVRWLKKEGDWVDRGEPLIEVETDKAVMEVNAAASGRLAKILAPQGTAVKVEETFAVLAGDQESIAETAGGPASAAAAEVSRPAAPPPRAGGRVPVSPAARRLAKERGVSLLGITGSGPDGMIVERDVERAAGAAAPTPVAEADVEVIPLAGARKVIAERMVASLRTTAQVTAFIDVDVTRLGELRKEVKATYTAFVVAAAARLLPRFPYLNASLEGDRILLRKRVHIGVAVAVGDALVVPVVRDADRKGLREIAREMGELAEKGRERRLSAEEMQGATFTVTNPGVYGTLFSTPIINLPECALVGIGRVSRAPVVRGDQIAIGEVMYLFVSYDHRLVDGALVAQFLSGIKESLENPDSLVG